MADPRETGRQIGLPPQEVFNTPEIVRNTSLVLQTPGQGTQAIKLAWDIAERSGAAKEIKIMAGDIFGGEFMDTWENDPRERIDDTEMAQKIITTATLMRMVALEDNYYNENGSEKKLGEISWYDTTGKLDEKYRVGLSVGLVAAGAGVWYSAEDAIRFMKVRSDLTGEFFKGLDAKMFVVEKVPEDIQEEMGQKCDVRPLLYNTDTQTVWGGPTAEVESAQKWLQEKKREDAEQEADKRRMERSRVMVLPIGGVFHHPLLEPVARALIPCVYRMQFYDSPQGKVLLSNVTGKPLKTADDVQTELTLHLFTPDRHRQGMEYVRKQGATTGIALDASKRLVEMNKSMFGGSSEAVMMPQKSPTDNPPVLARLWTATTPITA